MTEQHHEAVRCLLQQMTERYLTTVPGFADVMTLYNITTIHTFEKHSPAVARMLKEPRNFVADIYSPEHPEGIRHEFVTDEERNHFLNHRVFRE
ncbi:TPA: hypothetical protein I8Y21_006395 [Klebsiella oxytoca]|uniref:Uncharacterized protein n=1 Tax=Klebsiella oxytoca TaxID=571 RepID=A0AAN5LGH2_KLEOX|nr:hypothetical protein [Klebsiella oxytoca]